MDKKEGVSAGSDPRARKRPRPSISSIQPALSPVIVPQFTPSEGVFPEQWQGRAPGQPNQLALATQMNEAGLMQLQSLQEFNGPQSPTAPGPHFGQPLSPNAAGLVQMQAMSRHALPNMSNVSYMSSNTDFTADDSHVADLDDMDDDASTAMAGGGRKSRNSSANNDGEMRQLFQMNRHRSITEVATELHGNERGPNSERARQIIAMLWINESCRSGKGSVPRGRVYAEYASTCANERIAMLNPASFGKLVRVLFPGLKTRRLGVRGESKYHYVNFVLEEGTISQPIQAAPALPQMSLDAAIGLPHLTASQVSEPAFAQNLPPLLSATATTRKASDTAPSQLKRKYAVYSDSRIDSLEDLEVSSGTAPLTLHMLSAPVSPFAQGEAFSLPDIRLFAPRGADEDAVRALAAIYLSHSISIIEAVRYCKEKQLLHQYTSFQGTLTTPVQKLLDDPALAPWVERCDFATYKAAIRIIASLALQVVPEVIVKLLKCIGSRLANHVRDALQDHPSHLIKARVIPATYFSHLVDRALQVNLTAHAAASVLARQDTRDQMFEDWIANVRIKKIGRCVPARAMTDTLRTIVTELRGLLNPSPEKLGLEGAQPYRDFSATQEDSKPASPETAGEERIEDDAVVNVIDRWVQFMYSLPERFPYASAEDLIVGVHEVSAQILRDVTTNTSRTFPAWWFMKCWVDELIFFNAELGGFMQVESSDASTSEPAETEPIKKATSSHASSSKSEAPRHNPALPDRAPFPPATSGISRQQQIDTDVASIAKGKAKPIEAQPSTPPANGEDSGGDSLVPSVPDNHDDSGIAMQTPEPDKPSGFRQEGTSELDV